MEQEIPYGSFVSSSTRSSENKKSFIVLGILFFVFILIAIMFYAIMSMTPKEKYTTSNELKQAIASSMRSDSKIVAKVSVKSKGSKGTYVDVYKEVKIDSNVAKIPIASGKQVGIIRNKEGVSILVAVDEGGPITVKKIAILVNPSDSTQPTAGEVAVTKTSELINKAAGVVSKKSPELSWSDTKHTAYLYKIASKIAKNTNGTTVPESKKVVEVLRDGKMVKGYVIEESNTMRTVFLTDYNSVEKFKKSDTPIVSVEKQELINVKNKRGKTIPGIVVESSGDVKKVVIIGSNDILVVKPRLTNLINTANQVSKVLNGATVPDTRKYVSVSTLDGDAIGIVIEETKTERLVYLTDRDELQKFQKSASPITKVGKQEIITVTTKDNRIIPAVVVATLPDGTSKRVVLVGVGRIVTVKMTGTNSDPSYTIEDAIKDEMTMNSHSYARRTGDSKMTGLKSIDIPRTTQDGHEQLKNGVREMVTDSSGLFGMGNVFMAPSTPEGDTMSVTEKANNRAWGSVMPFAGNERDVWSKMRLKPQANTMLTPAYHAWHSFGLYVNRPAFDYGKYPPPEPTVGDVYLME